MCDCQPIQFEDLKPGVVYHFTLYEGVRCDRAEWFLVLATGVTWHDLDANWERENDVKRPTDAIIDLHIESHYNDITRPPVQFLTKENIAAEVIYRVPPERLEQP